MNPVFVIARITFHEASRKRLVVMALAAGAAFLLLFAIAIHFQSVQFNEQHIPLLLRRSGAAAMQTMGMYVVNFLIVAITVLVSVDTLSGEIASGAIQAIAMKPIERWQLVAGKWLGFCLMLTCYSALMIFGLNGLTSWILGTAARHLVAAFGLMWLESMLLLSTTIFFGVWLSTLTTGVVVLGLHGLAFLAGWIEQAGTLTQTPKAVTAGVVASLVMPTESLWRRAAFELQSPLVTALNITPFSSASLPSRWMVAYAAVYTCLMAGLAARAFTTRDL